MIEVLWIDDESKKEEYRYYIMKAEEKGIILNPEEFEDDGIIELNKNYHKYDAIVLDVITKKSQGATEMENHQNLLDRVILTMNSEGRGELPVFIFSGQTGKDDKASYLHKYYENSIKYDLYIKQKDEDKLWKDIRTKVLNKKVLKIKSENKMLITNSKLLNDNIHKRILTLLFHIEDYVPINKPWGEMRDLLDDLVNNLIETKNCSGKLIDETEGRAILGFVTYYFKGNLYVPPPKYDTQSKKFIYIEEDLVKNENVWDNYMTSLLSNFIPILQALNHSVSLKLTSEESTKQKNLKAIWESQRKNKYFQRSVVYQLFMLVEYIANRYYKNS